MTDRVGRNPLRIPFRALTFSGRSPGLIVTDNKIQHIPSVKTGGRRLLAIGLALIVAEILSHSAVSPLVAADIQRALCTWVLGPGTAFRFGITIGNADILAAMFFAESALMA